MKKRYLAAAAVIVLISLFIPGAAGAITPDAQAKDIYWNMGSQGFTLGVMSSRSIYTDTFTVPVGPTPVTFIGPMSVPSSLDSNPCSVSKIYLNWNAPPECYLLMVNVYTSGENILHLTPTVYGTGTDHVVTIDLGGLHAIPRGMVIEFPVCNTGGSAAVVEIHGYGAMIRHKA